MLRVCRKLKQADRPQKSWLQTVGSCHWHQHWADPCSSCLRKVLRKLQLQTERSVVHASATHSSHLPVPCMHLNTLILSIAAILNASQHAKPCCCHTICPCIQPKGAYACLLHLKPGQHMVRCLQRSDTQHTMWQDANKIHLRHCSRYLARTISWYACKL